MDEGPGTPPRQLNPRWRRYSLPYLVSAPELWDPQAVERALDILRAEQASQEGPEEALERPESPDDDYDGWSPSR
jgi:hypothetical protein